MRLLVLADGRSPITRNWLGGLLRRSLEVHLASTFGCHPLPQLASLHNISVAFSGSGIRRSDGTVRPPGGARWMQMRARLRHWLGPFTLAGAAKQFEGVVARVEPDLIHAMRIPFEGMVAEAADLSTPWLVSVWGNDFTLHAPASPLMTRQTRRVLTKAYGLHTDTNRDLRLATQFGFDPTKPSAILPGNGGVRKDVFHPVADEPSWDPTIQASIVDVPDQAPIVINPRGLRGYVRNDTFFKAIPLILQHKPEVHFFCPAMRGESEAENWIERLELETNVHLLPQLTPEQMASMFNRSTIMVSPSEHDGTPNSLLEAMACGCFPVVGDLESLREWISDGQNGLLVDPTDPQALTAAVLRVFEEETLHRNAIQTNFRIIEERAEHEQVMNEVLALYQRML